MTLYHFNILYIKHHAEMTTFSSLYLAFCVHFMMAENNARKSGLIRSQTWSDQAINLQNGLHKRAEDIFQHILHIMEV